MINKTKMTKTSKYNFEISIKTIYDIKIACFFICGNKISIKPIIVYP